MFEHKRRVLVIGLDGMRPDLFDPEIMPNLAGLVGCGTRMPDHHAVFPTHTRVNVSTLATGAYPGHHGVVANVFQLNGDTPDGTLIVDTSNDQHLRDLDAASYGPAILRPALGDILDRHDKRVAVAATSSAGAGILWTRNQPYRVVNPNSHYNRADLLSLREKLGPIPPAGPDYKRERQMYAGRAVTEIFLHDEDLPVIVLWLNEPDSSLHGNGLGAPEVRSALEICDEVIGYVLDTMERRGDRDQFDVIVLSDHGHSTVKHHRSLGEYLDRASRELGLPDPLPSTASDFVYFSPETEHATVAQLVRWIQDQYWAGAVFASGEFGSLPGVLRIEDVWGGVTTHRSPTLAVSPAWYDEENEYGVPGTVAALTEHVALRATHGSASPYELHGFLAASGPSFQEGLTTSLPTGAVDLTPTILQIIGLTSDNGFDGRVLWEALTDTSETPGAHRRESVGPATPHPDGFRPEIILERVGSTTYVDRVLNG
ncbi:hypothetical protein BH23CHL2_BH23CHL2_00510 [soil metagenome]